MANEAHKAGEGCSDDLINEPLFFVLEGNEFDLHQLVLIEGSMNTLKDLLSYATLPDLDQRFECICSGFEKFLLFGRQGLHLYP